jgi:hypothetical protein
MEDLRQVLNDLSAYDDTIFFDERSTELGGEWPFAIAEALRNCRVFAYLHSPLYFRRPQCGKEWYAFRRRMETAGVGPVHANPLSPMIPIHWISTAYAIATVPEEITKIEFTSPSMDGRYVLGGMRKLVRIGGSTYYECVRRLAQHILRCSQLVGLSPGGEIDFAGMPSAFHPQDQSAQPLQSPNQLHGSTAERLDLDRHASTPDIEPSPAKAPSPDPLDSRQSTAGPSTLFVHDRKRPEYWLHRVKTERQLLPGGDPLVLISFASEDQAWISDLRDFLDPRIEQLKDADGRPYRPWGFSDVNRGTAPGDEFPEVIAEKMWCCRVALLVLSKGYFRSGYCRAIELPFLFWRREHHGLMCIPVRLGTLPIQRVRLPEYEYPSRSVDFNDLIDDRQAAADFANSPYRERSLKQLKEDGKESEIEIRFEGVARRVANFLKNRHAASDIE